MDFLPLLLQGISWIIIVDVVASWLVRDVNRFPRNITSAITAPLYRPLHAIIDPSKMGGIDIAPLIIYFILQAIVQQL